MHALNKCVWLKQIDTSHENFKSALFLYLSTTVQGLIVEYPTKLLVFGLQSLTEINV